MKCTYVHMHIHIHIYLHTHTHVQVAEEDRTGKEEDLGDANYNEFFGYSCMSHGTHVKESCRTCV